MDVQKDRVLRTLGHVEPHWLSGTYEELSGDIRRIVFFAYRAPKSWRFEEGGRVTEVSDPRRTIVVKDGVGIVHHGTVVVNNLIKSFVLSKKFVDEDFLNLIEFPVTQNVARDRETWTFSIAETNEKPRAFIEMDAQTGVFLSMEAGPRRGQLQNLDFDHAPGDSIFTWHGPTRLAEP